MRSLLPQPVPLHIQAFGQITHQVDARAAALALFQGWVKSGGG
jgi:hypothetical protein